MFLLRRRENKYSSCISFPFLFFLSLLAYIFTLLPLSFAQEKINLNIPPEYGRMVESYSGKDGRLIIQIQDLHTNYEAQIKEAKIIYHLLKKQGYRLVATEGAKGEIDTSIFDLFTNYKDRKKVANFFMRKAQITAPEYLHILGKHPFLLYGVEDEDIYRQHLLSFQRLLSFRKEILQYCHQVKRALEIIKDHLSSPELKELEERISAYSNNELSLKRYALYLSRMCKKHNIALKDFPDFKRLSLLIRLEKSIDFEKAKEQQIEAIKELTPFLSEKELAELIVKTSRSGSGKLSLSKYYLYLKDLFRNKGLSLSSYPQFNRYLSYLFLSQQINHRRLFREIKDLERLVKKTLYTHPDQERLERLLVNIEVLENSVNIRLSSKELDYYYRHQFEFNPYVFFNFIQNYKKLCGFSPPFYDFSPFLEKMERFYALARERDRLLLENTLRVMKEKGEKKSILFCGGFHTQGITHLLKKKGISYVVIAPYVKSKVNSRLYFSSLRGEVVSSRELESLKRELIKR
ncbi:MAG: hypothetical protein DRP75_04530 [Candidatus Omnitrophota bacterium]|nr:MAG: hypothetical protein DRP75_04530 [Candidatus Omnitrophota bacterium]